MTLRSFVRENAWLLASGVAIEAALIFLVGLGDLRRQIPLFWAGIFSAFAFYLIAMVRLGRRPQGSVGFVLLAALIFRLTMWWSPPTLSDDIYRYIWDGRVQLAGINPYQYAPAAPEVAPLRDALHAKINHPEIPTVYPPLSQLFFRLVGAVQPGVGAVKLALILVECGLLLLLVRILKQRAMDRRRVFFFGFAPDRLLEGLAGIDVAGDGNRLGVGVESLGGGAVLDKYLSGGVEHGRVDAGLGEFPLFSAAVVDEFAQDYVVVLHFQQVDALGVVRWDMGVDWVHGRCRD